MARAMDMLMMAMTAVALTAGPLPAGERSVGGPALVNRMDEGTTTIQAPVTQSTAGPRRRVAPVSQIWVPPVHEVITGRVWLPAPNPASGDATPPDPAGGGRWVGVRRLIVVREGYWQTVAGPEQPLRRYPSGYPVGRRVQG